MQRLRRCTGTLFYGAAFTASAVLTPGRPQIQQVAGPVNGFHETPQGGHTAAPRGSPVRGSIASGGVIGAAVAIALS